MPFVSDLTLPELLQQERHVMNRLPVDCSVIAKDALLGRHLFQIAWGEVARQPDITVRTAGLPND